jgi:AraC-like DNA-binding protein
MARIVRHASERDRWEFAYAAPDPRLRAHVLGYCGYDERTASFVRRRELPSDRVVAIVNLGAPIRVQERSGEWVVHADGFLAGIDDTFSITETGGAQRGVQVDLSPVGAHLLLRLPMHELAYRVVELNALFGRRAALLREQLAEATSWEEAFAALDAFLLARLDDALSPVPSVTRALARLKQSAGAVGVAELAQEIGCSRRHLSAGFREQVGIPPKLYARLLRFERAVSLAGSAGWGEISAACGYYDQAHMIRDFQQFAGVSPTELERLRLPAGGGVRA